MGHQCARLQWHHRQQAPRADRWTHGLHTALLRRILGCAGGAPRGHRPDRGHQRARGHAVGSQRRQRRDQCHHKGRQGHARGAAVGRRRDRAARLRNRPLRRGAGVDGSGSDLRQSVWSRCDGVAQWPGRRRRLAPVAGWVPHGLGRVKREPRHPARRSVRWPHRPAHSCRHRGQRRQRHGEVVAHDLRNVESRSPALL